MFDSAEICQDDECTQEDLHPAHVKQRRSLTSAPVLTARLRAKPKPTSGPWQKRDAEGLRDSILRAIGARPMMISWISRDVRDDYGSCNDRTIYRYVRRLVDTGAIVKVDLGLHFCVYVQPGARALKDRESLRDYMLSQVEVTRCGKKAKRVIVPTIRADRPAVESSATELTTPPMSSDLKIEFTPHELAPLQRREPLRQAPKTGDHLGLGRWTWDDVGVDLRPSHSGEFDVGYSVQPKEDHGIDV